MFFSGAIFECERTRERLLRVAIPLGVGSFIDIG